MSSIRASTWRTTARTIAIAGLGLALAGAAQAQMTDAQKSAIRSLCRSDYMSNCTSVPPGGKEALECLKSHLAKLSPACQHAVNAASPPAAAAPTPPAAPKPAVVTAPPPPAAAPPPHKAAVTAPPPPPAPPHKKAAAEPPPHKKAAAPPAAGLSLSAAEQNALREHCSSDFAAHCVGITPGTKVALVCLQRNIAHLSPACRQVVGVATPPETAVAALPPHAKPMPVTPAVAPPPPAAAPPPPALTRAQQRAMRDYCRSDFARHCRGVPPGGREALICLQRHEREISAPCRGVVIATMPAPRVRTAVPLAAPRAEPAMPMGRIESIPMRERLAIVRSCRSDQQMLCRGERPGGGRIIVCLAEHRAQLSPPCRGALMRAMR